LGHQLKLRRVSDHVYFKVLNELATEEFNKELYGVEDLGANYTGTVAPFIQEKLNLIMAGEESTVGGVTVQQYLAEVELLLILHLQALTRSFSRRAKYRKNKIYYI
jgi:hypothetical protein